MRRREFIARVGGVVVAWPLAVQAQQVPARSLLLGVLLGLADKDKVGQQLAASLRMQLNILGWSEGPHFRIEFRMAGFDVERSRTLAAGLVQLNPDVMLVNSTQTLTAILAAGHAGSIVFVNVGGNLVEKGFIQSYARPGGNVTGITNADEEFEGKRLELLKQIVPDLSRVLVIGSRTHPNWKSELAKYKEPANILKLRLSTFDADNNDELEGVVRSFAQEPGGGMDVPPSTYTFANREAIIAMAARHKLPAVYPYRVFVTDGGLAAYTFDVSDQWRAAASYVDRILRGEKPGDLPVQQPTKFQTVINLSTAKALGLMISPSLLGRADEMIE